MPALADAGVKGAEMYEWNALFAPAGTPAPVVAKLSAALRKVLAAPEVRQRIEQLGGDIKTTSPEQAQAFIRAQMDKASQLIKARNITVE